MWIKQTDNISNNIYETMSNDKMTNDIGLYLHPNIGVSDVMNPVYKSNQRKAHWLFN